MIAWRPVPGFVGVEASCCGQLRRVGQRRQGLLRPYPSGPRLLTPKTHHRDGRQVIALTNTAGRQVTVTVARLVALAFHGPEPDGAKLDASHLDGDDSSLEADNLTLESRSANMRRRLDHGTMPDRNAAGRWLPMR